MKKINDYIYAFTERYGLGNGEFWAKFAGFCIIGISNVIIFYLVNIFCLYLLSSYKNEWDFVIANLVSFVLSVIWSFYWNKKLVFHHEHESFMSELKSLGRAFMAYAFCGIVLNNLLSYLWIHGLNISKLIAPLLNVIVTTPINFFLNDKWTFR